MSKGAFPIPAALHDLERDPYNLLPYPEDFDDDDEAARAESFDALVQIVETGNRTVVNSTIALFESEDEDEEAWCDEERMQALYTLVRKSGSIAGQTKKRLVEALSKSVHALARILSSFASANADGQVPGEFRAAFSFHLYMLFSVMFFAESEAKGTNGLGNGTNNKAEVMERDALRATCADAMLVGATAMCQHRSQLWKRGVADEAVAILPCRIAYQMLESATGVVARRGACGDQALQMICATVDSSESLQSTVVAALVDLLHDYEHMAPLVAELCGMVKEDPTNRLAMELIREVGRLNPSSGSDGGKASGIRNVAPFISDLARMRPRLVLTSISHILPHLNAEPYSIRSSIATAIGHILVYIGTVKSGNEDASNLDFSKSRNALLDVLSDRVLDVSSFTRGAVMKAWISIVRSGALPIDRLLPVTTLASDRLQDKTVMVRRSAMQLLTSLLEHNPFLGSLDPKPYRVKLGEVYESLKANMPKDIKEAQEAARKDAEDQDDEEALAQLDQAALSAAIADADAMENVEDLSETEAEFRSQVQALKFAQSALDFIDQFEYANEACQGMLLSANTSDVTEALRFFVRARTFQLPCATTGMKQALALMWSTEKSIQNEVLQAFVEVFIAVPGTDGKENLPEKQIAHNLLVLVGRASLSELASIEEALGRLVKDERIPADVFLILWSIASKANGEARAAALLLLSMAASTDRSIVDSASRLKLLLEAGLGDYVEERRDWKTVRSAACALQKISIANLDPMSAKAIMLEQTIERLCVVVRGDWCVDDNSQDTLSWFSAAEQSIDALFVVAEEAETECANIIRAMAAVTFGVEGDDERPTNCHSLRLARFFFVVGHIALKLLVYTEFLSGALRRGNAMKSLKNQEMADKAKESQGEGGEDAIEAELGVAAEIEAENERRFNDISEKEILSRGLISSFTPLLIRVVGNEGGNFPSEILRQSANLALCKFMCISISFCEDHLPLIFTALANAPAHDTILRANTVVALGDHAFRFPNEVEPYTPRLYACLRDSSTKVRRHTLMVLTHLILNDMVKVKGQVCEIAMCLRDEDPRIRDMSRLLFFELSKRTNNPIYNLLPDIISQLSQQSMKKEDFRGIMGFLLGFIKKERQNEMLVEKLLQRFPKCDTISQKADLAFCLASLKINERSVKTLTDLFRLYKDALFDEEVKKSFFSIVARAKKFAKPEMKECLEEWEKKLDDHSLIGQENQAAGQKAKRAKAKAAKRKTKRGKQRPVLDDELSLIEEEETNKENMSMEVQ